jgi:potassium-dependent mechanosensitive channel
MRIQFFRKLLWVSGLIIICAGIGCQQLMKEAEGEGLHIALAAPMSGPSKTVGKSFVQGVRLYIDAVNRDGGINGRPVVLDVYDDQNNTQLAQEEAFKIVQNDQVLAVIGHHYSTCSISAGEIYKEYGVPAISPASTNVRVTQDNPWYFRSAFNDNLQGRFLANYARKVFGTPVVSIIYEDEDYGAYLAKVFEETSRELGSRVRYTWKFDPADRYLDEELKRIVYDLKSKDDAGVVFLATHADPGIKILKAMKDSLVLNPVMGPDAFASETFQKGFEVFPKERRNPGFYTNGMYVTTPLIFDTTNEKGQRFQDAYRKAYGEVPGWHAAFAYDSAMVVVHALKNAGLGDAAEDPAEIRRKIRNFLAGMNSIEEAVEGVTGYNYFDSRGDSQKPVLIGVYKNRNIVSALTQFQTISNPAELSHLESARKQDRVLFFDGQYMYRINVVYTGIEINEISNLNFKDLTCDLDFHLWFRYQGEIDLDDMVFLNAVEPIPLGEPIRTRTTRDELQYRIYRIQGRFRIDFLPGQADYGEHTLGVSFRHPEMDRNNLIYVKDVLGMGYAGDDQALLDKMKKAQTLSPASGWKLRQVGFFQDTVEENGRGNPEYLNINGGSVDFSRFNMWARIAPDQFILRDLVPETWVNYMLAFSLGLVLILPLVGRTRTFQPHLQLIWVLQFGAALLLLLAAEFFLIDQLAGTYYLAPLITLINMLWWIIPAVLLGIGVDRFIWLPLEEKTARSVPRIIRNSTILLIYLLAFFGIVAFVFDQRLTSLLATSGVIAMIIGLAIQINISNIFSGIAINVERPFRVGDWVKISSFKEGKVIDINWRTTRIQSREGTVLCIPNSQASESVIENFSTRNEGYFLYFTIHVDPSHAPDRVKKILMDAALSSEGVEKEPPPVTRFLGLTAGITGQSESWAANYLIGIYVHNYEKKYLYNETVWTHVWTHLRRSGIKPIVPRQETRMILEGIRRRKALPDKALTLLEELDIFKPFGPDARRYLSERMKLHRFYPGESIVRQGEGGDSLFILDEGVVSVRVKFDTRTRPIEVARMGAGNFFGEMALLTGEKRTASIISLTETRLYEITKEDIAPLLEEEPRISKVLSDILTQRKMSTEAQKGSEDEEGFDKETLATQIFNKIQTFFGFKR